MKKYCHKNQLFFFFQAEKKYLKTYNIKEHQSSYGILHTSTLGLRFRVAKKHFQPDGDMKLKCKASIGKIFALRKIGSGHCIDMLAGTFRGRLYYILRSNFLLPGSEFNFLNQNDGKNSQSVPDRILSQINNFSRSL